MSKKKRFIKPLIIGAAVSVILGVCLAWLTLGSYKACDEARSALISDAQVTVTRKGALTVFEPTSYERGFIFYPGGRVEHTAYAPLLRAMAENGCLCVLVEMPFDFAFLNMDGALDALKEYPEIEAWSIGGHSLGGAMAASHAAKYPEKYDTLLLLAAYSTADLSDSGIRVISAYGENDGVLSLDKYEDNKKNLPSDTLELIIEGGNHAMFGDYGEQSGDGKAEITPQEQIAAVIKLVEG